MLEAAFNVLCCDLVVGTQLFILLLLFTSISGFIHFSMLAVFYNNFKIY